MAKKKKIIRNKDNIERGHIYKLLNNRVLIPKYFRLEHKGDNALFCKFYILLKSGKLKYIKEGCIQYLHLECEKYKDRGYEVSETGNDYMW